MPNLSPQSEILPESSVKAFEVEDVGLAPVTTNLGLIPLVEYLADINNILTNRNSNSAIDFPAKSTCDDPNDGDSNNNDDSSNNLPDNCNPDNNDPNNDNSGSPDDPDDDDQPEDPDDSGASDGTQAPDVDLGIDFDTPDQWPYWGMFRDLIENISQMSRA